MIKKLLELYKVPLLASATLTIVLIALKLRGSPFDFSLILLGSLLGTFALDLDYIIYTFFLEPTSDFSKTLSGFIKHGDIGNTLSYIYYHRFDIKELTLNSALFQIVLGAVSIFVVSSNTNFLVKSLVLSAQVNSLYRMSEHYFHGKLEDWFWILKEKPSKQAFYLYSAGILLLLLVSLQFF